jgi:hypothetical protein
MLRCKQWSALRDWVKVVNGQVIRLAAHLAPRALTPNQGTQFLPGWIEIGVRASSLPAGLSGCSMSRAAIPNVSEHATVKARSVEGHVFGKFGSAR